MMNLNYLGTGDTYLGLMEWNRHRIRRFCKIRDYKVGT